MNFNITFVRKVGTKLVTIKDKTFDVDFLSIGSNRDQDLFLDDVYVIGNHAQIVIKKSKLLVVAVDGENAGGISVNNRLLQNKKLKKGDVLNFGSFEITVLDLGSNLSKIDLQVEKKTDGIPVTRALPSRSSLSLENTWLKKRRWSVKSFGLLLIFFLLIPLFGYFMPSTVSESLRNLPIVPSDNSWDSGELAYAHHIEKIGDNCNTCHEKPFVMVEDKSCANSTCHQRIQEHVDPESYVENNLDQQRCGSCHEEHNGANNDLINSNDSLCSSCHHAITIEGHYDAKGDNQNIHDFDTLHPEFRLSMYKLDQDSMTFVLDRQSLKDIASLKEQSNLKFPHDKHLVYKGIENLTTGEKDSKLTCDSCHVPVLSGDGFKPIIREKHCQECHLLTFEPEYPSDSEKQVPHGSVAEVIDYLKGYYSDRALNGKRQEAQEVKSSDDLKETSPVKPPPRFRPGTSYNESGLSDEERATIHKWVEKKVDIASNELFNFTTCTLCHSITENQDSKHAWSILPVRINESWFPKAKLFNHKKHATEKCISCHDKKVTEDVSLDDDADVNVNVNKGLDENNDKKISRDETQLASSDSSDILMPNMDKCKQCHSSNKVANKIKTSCVTCHGFHTNEKHQMSKGGSQND